MNGLSLFFLCDSSVENHSTLRNNHTLVIWEAFLCIYRMTNFTCFTSPKQKACQFETMRNFHNTYTYLCKALYKSSFCTIHLLSPLFLFFSFSIQARVILTCDISTCISCSTCQIVGHIDNELNFLEESNGRECSRDRRDGQEYGGTFYH